MKFRIEIECDNAAFFPEDYTEQDKQKLEDWARRVEVDRILRQCSRYLDSSFTPGDSYKLHDKNGNTVGKMSLSHR